MSLSAESPHTTLLSDIPRSTAFGKFGGTQRELLGLRAGDWHGASRAPSPCGWAKLGAQVSMRFFPCPTASLRGLQGEPREEMGSSGSACLITGGQVERLRSHGCGSEGCAITQVGTWAEGRRCARSSNNAEIHSEGTTAKGKAGRSWGIRWKWREGSSREQAWCALPDQPLGTLLPVLHPSLWLHGALLLPLTKLVIYWAFRRI